MSQNYYCTTHWFFSPLFALFFNSLEHCATKDDLLSVLVPLLNLPIIGPSLPLCVSVFWGGKVKEVFSILYVLSSMQTMDRSDRSLEFRGKSSLIVFPLI